MPEIKTYDINLWPVDWREKGEMAKKKLLANPQLGVNSPEYHEYMDYCRKCILFEQETGIKHCSENEGMMEVIGE